MTIYIVDFFKVWHQLRLHLPYKKNNLKMPERGSSQKFLLYSKMNMRQNHIFYKFSKVIRQFVWLFTCFVKIVNLKLFLFWFALLLNNFTDLTKIKTRESTILCIGNFEENMDLSHIHILIFSCTKSTQFLKSPLL